MRATILNCTLKSSPEPSNTEALARVVGDALSGAGVEVELVRVVDHDVKPGVSSDEGRPVAYNRVAGFVVTGNEDGAHHCIAELAQGLIDIGWTVPGQSWTYWNRGPGPSFTETDEGRDWSASTGRAAAGNLVAAARALAANPIPAPAS
jgi:multimeric flavodoxin WrbA